MSERFNCAFCENVGTKRDDEYVYFCASHRAALRWKTMAPQAVSEPRERVPADYVLELIGRSSMLAG
jgi:hypothetical protein